MVDPVRDIKGLYERHVAPVLSSVSDVVDGVRKNIQNVAEHVVSFLGNVTSLSIADFQNFRKSHGESDFSKMLENYAQQAEVQATVVEVQQLVKDGYLAHDIGAAMIEKITGATKVANSREHRSIVALADAQKALDLIQEKIAQISEQGLTGEELERAKTEVSLRVRLSFEAGGVAAITDKALNRDITTIFHDKVFDTQALNMSEDELWENFKAQIMELDAASPQDAISYLGHPSLSRSGDLAKAKEDIEAEQQLLREIFGEKIKKEKEARRTDTGVAYDAYFQGTALNNSGFSSLLSFIAEGEGGYNSMNQGTRGNRIVGSTHNASSILGKNLTDMTIQEIMGHQSSGALFAAGRYQIIPSTMKLALEYSGLSPSDRFSPENQDRLAIALIMQKRPVIGQYLRGVEGVTIDEAMLHLAMEWASVPDPRTGSSFYGHGNRALHNVSEVRTALLNARNEIMGSDYRKTLA